MQPHLSDPKDESRQLTLSAASIQELHAAVVEMLGSLQLAACELNLLATQCGSRTDGIRRLVALAKKAYAFLLPLEDSLESYALDRSWTSNVGTSVRASSHVCAVRWVVDDVLRMLVHDEQCTLPEELDGSDPHAARDDREQRAWLCMESALRYFRRGDVPITLRPIGHKLEIELQALLRASGRRPTPQQIALTFPSDELAIVRKGDYESQIRGRTCVRLFRTVTSQPHQDHSWKEIFRAWAEEDNRGLTAAEDARTPQMPATIQRTGRRVRSSLGELSCYWHHPRGGVRWNPPTSP